ncbi:uncharacterized protein LOC141939950 [Strix uralensis]|uniref:uncharacterized protein LOC141939950 n=1 Tax=Strix uralensis TaxID=36305 RepID=UPI003DA76DA9
MQQNCFAGDTIEHTSRQIGEGGRLTGELDAAGWSSTPRSGAARCWAQVTPSLLRAGDTRWQEGTRWVWAFLLKFGPVAGAGSVAHASFPLHPDEDPQGEAVRKTREEDAARGHPKAGATHRGVREAAHCPGRVGQGTRLASPGEAMIYQQETQIIHPFAVQRPHLLQGPLWPGPPLDPASSLLCSRLQRWLKKGLRLVQTPRVGPSACLAFAPQSFPLFSSLGGACGALPILPPRLAGLAPPCPAFGRLELRLGHSLPAPRPCVPSGRPRRIFFSHSSPRLLLGLLFPPAAPGGPIQVGFPV